MIKDAFLWGDPDLDHPKGMHPKLAIVMNTCHVAMIINALCNEITTVTVHLKQTIHFPATAKHEVSPHLSVVPS